MLRTEKRSCICFLSRGQIDLVRDPLSPTLTYRCLHCGALLEDIKRSELEYDLAWRAGKESEFLRAMAKERDRDQRWGTPLTWLS